MTQIQTSPQLLGVRDTLKNRFGVADERMGWDGEYVTIDGKRAIKPAKNVDGTTLATEADFNSASGSIGALNTQHQLMQQVLGGAGVAGQNAAAVNPIDQQFNEMLEMLSGRVTGQSPITMQDVYSSPLFAAQQAQIARQSHQATRAAQESLGDAGFGRSTRLMDRTQTIQNDANNYLNTQAVPMIMQTLQSERDRETAELLDLLGLLGQERQFQDTRSNNQFGRTMELLGYQTDQSNRAEDQAYQRERDRISDTGQLPDGTWTQQGYNNNLERQVNEYNLEELMNPQSRTNIMKDLELRVAQMEAEYLPKEQKLRLQQLQKQIANIGARAPQTAAEAEYDRLQVEKLRKEIDLMDNGSPYEPMSAGQFDTYIDLVNKRYGLVDDEGTFTMRDPYNVRKGIISLNLPDEETIKLLQYYGLPIESGTYMGGGGR